MSPAESIKQQLIENTRKAVEARFDFEYPSFTADAVELNKSLIEAQDILTTLEKLLSEAISVKASADRILAANKLTFQHRWDEAIVAANKRPGLSEYATGKEKAAEANLATFTLARGIHQQEQLVSQANEATDVIRLHYYGMDKVRQDLRKRLDLASADYRNAS